MIKTFRTYLLFIIISFLLLSCRHLGTIEKVDTAVISIDTSSFIKEDTSMLHMIKPFKEKMDSEMNEVLGYTTEVMIKDRPEGLLNNFVADLILIKSNEYYKPGDGAKIDFCVMNNGGLRASLPKGALTRGNIYELMPFDNDLVVLTLTGEKTMEMFNFIAKAGGVPVSGFSMGIKDTTAVNISLNGKVFDLTKEYKIVTSDYLSNGGDKMYFFNDPLKTEDLNVKIRDAIISYVIDENAKGNKLESKLDKRIYYEK